MSRVLKVSKLGITHTRERDAREAKGHDTE